MISKLKRFIKRYKFSQQISILATLALVLSLPIGLYAIKLNQDNRSKAYYPITPPAGIYNGCMPNANKVIMITNTGLDNTCTSIHTAIANIPDNEPGYRIQYANGHFELTKPLAIQNKSSFTITGSGDSHVRFHCSDQTQLAINNVTNFNLQNLDLMSICADGSVVKVENSQEVRFQGARFDFDYSDAGPLDYAIEINEVTGFYFHKSLVSSSMDGNNLKIQNSQPVFVENSDLFDAKISINVVGGSVRIQNSLIKGFSNAGVLVNILDQVEIVNNTMVGGTNWIRSGNVTLGEGEYLSKAVVIDGNAKGKRTLVFEKNNITRVKHGLEWSSGVFTSENTLRIFKNNFFDLSSNRLEGLEDKAEYSSFNFDPLFFQGSGPYYCTSSKSMLYFGNEDYVGYCLNYIPYVINPSPSSYPTASPSTYPTPSHSPTTSPYKKCRGDMNRDEVVDLSDYAILARNLLKSPEQVDTPSADVNKDGVVDLSDYALLASSLLKPCIPN